jgi:hypothetical protein
MNTRIRGAQINLADETIVVASDSLAFYDATDGAIKRESIADFISAIAGNGIIAGSGVLSINPDGVSIGFSEATGEAETLVVKLGTTPGIAITNDGLILDVDSLAGIGADAGDDIWIPFMNQDMTGRPTGKFSLDSYMQALVGDGLTWNTGFDVSIDAGNINAGAGSAGQVLTKGTGDTLSWATPSAITEDYIQEAEIVTENHSADILVTGWDETFELGFAPVLSSVQVFLNGLLQEEGTGKDYNVSGTGNKVITFDTTPVAGDIVIIHYIKN